MVDSEQLAGIIGRAIQAETRHLTDRIKQLEAREPLRGEKGSDGLDGASGAAGKDGRDGVDGKDGANGRDGADAAPVTREAIIEAVLSMPELLDEAVQRYLAGNPPRDGKDGRDGVDGKDGKDGERGADGRDGVTGMNGKDGERGMDGVDGKDAEVTQLQLERAVASHLAAYPIHAGRDGRDGVAGPSGKDGADGKDGEKGADGANGKDGMDGKDGLSIEDFDIVVSEDARDLTVKLTNGEKCVEKTVHLPFVLDRGIYDKSAQYKQGDGVTRQGSFWIAQKDDPGEPAFAPDNGWRLAVKKGRDGKDGKDGERGPQGKEGPRGRTA